MKKVSVNKLFWFPQLLAILKNKSVHKSDNTLLSIAEFLLLHAYYCDTPLDGVDITNVEPDVRRICCDRLTSVLSEMCTLVPSGGASGSGREGRGVAGVVKDTGQPYVVALMSFAQQLPSQPLQDEVRSITT